MTLTTHRVAAAARRWEARVPAAALLLAATAMLGGCGAHDTRHAAAASVRPDPSGDVDANLLAPEPATRMQLASNQIFIQGDGANAHAMPAYPPALLPLRLPDQTVCVRFSVGEDGTVSNVQPIASSAECPQGATAQHPEFLAATIDAVLHWEYFSSIRCTFPPGTPDSDKCNGPGATAEHVAITLSYRFVFSSRDGSVTSHLGPA